MCFKKYYLPLETIASKHNLFFEKRSAFKLGHLERLKMNRAEIKTCQKTLSGVSVKSRLYLGFHGH
jgi:hypothetical protein